MAAFSIECEILAAADADTVLVDRSRQLTGGDRLDAGLAADQRLRKGREQKLRRGLRSASRLNAVARAGCVAAGILDLVLILGVAASLLLSSSLLNAAIAGLGLSFTALLAVSGLIAVGSDGLQWYLLKGARRAGLEVVSGTVTSARSRGEYDPAGSARAGFLQREIDRAHQDECTLGEVCLWAGYGSLVTAALIAASFVVGTATHIDGIFQCVTVVALCPWISVLIVLPFWALTAVLRGYRRKRLLALAARERHKVRDPAWHLWG